MSGSSRQKVHLSIKPDDGSEGSFDSLSRFFPSHEAALKAAEQYYNRHLWETDRRLPTWSDVLRFRWMITSSPYGDWNYRTPGRDIYPFRVSIEVKTVDL